MGITDCHVHINPVWEMVPGARELVGQHAKASEYERFLRAPTEFLEYLDRCGVDRAVIVNYVSPDVVGYTEKVNEFAGSFAAADPERLIAVGSVLPTHRAPGPEIERLARTLGIRAIKLHPPHQLFAPNAYVDGALPGLRDLYATCERLRLPVIFHTGTSIFPRARNKFGEPMLIEDVAIDFPNLTIVLAHGGRPLWMDQATFLVRRFKNVYLETSSIPPTKLLEYFPRLEALAEKVLFGSDWPGPGVADIGANLRAFQELPIAASAKDAILTSNPERVFPRAPPT
ncbi:MAG: amidohydrolase family protein [Thermoplasmata archaeon]|nr:amidohydrolase family protein [Thermoplasmata archaeon]